ncbi:hypothetical protein VPH35_099346 [Triticum aestivum]
MDIMRQKLCIYSGATNCKLLVQRYMWYCTAWILARHHYRELQTASCWCSDAGGAVQLVYWQGVTTELRNALSTSSDAFLLSKHMAYSITATSKGSVILPSHANPNSSWDILSSSPKSVVSRYVKGTSNRLPSAVYMVQCPLSAIGDVVQHALSSLEGCLTFCHFLTN